MVYYKDPCWDRGENKMEELEMEIGAAREQWP